jgi:2-hydroxy-6-oxonona-2,4-dienedioate hydrolase
MTVTKSSITVAGRKVSILRAGPSSGEPVLLVHGGRAGVSPIAYGSHIWGPALPLLAAGRPVIAVDLPGAGGSDLGSPDGLLADKVCQHLLGVLDALSINKAHFIGHDLGGYLGLWLAISAPARLRSLSILASPMAPPKGDGLDDITFLSAPKPMWSRPSQTWAFERLSYGQGHIDDALIDACVEAAQGKPHLDAVAALQDEQLRFRDFGISALKGKIWAALRGDGMSVPSQLVWSSRDPLAARDAGYVLFKIMAKKQKATYFHLINRAGSFAFREQPKEFAQVAVSFLDSVDARLAA